jgi:hypothetical protein
MSKTLTEAREEYNTALKALAAAEKALEAARTEYQTALRNYNTAILTEGE